MYPAGTPRVRWADTSDTFVYDPNQHAPSPFAAPIPAAKVQTATKAAGGGGAAAAAVKALEGRLGVAAQRDVVVVPAGDPPINTALWAAANKTFGTDDYYNTVLGKAFSEADRPYMENNAKRLITRYMKEHILSMVQRMQALMSDVATCNYSSFKIILRALFGREQLQDPRPNSFIDYAMLEILTLNSRNAPMFVNPQWVETIMTDNSVSHDTNVKYYLAAYSTFLTRYLITCGMVEAEARMAQAKSSKSRVLIMPKDIVVAVLEEPQLLVLFPKVVHDLVSLK